MKKIFILFLFFVSACGYQPLYKINKDFINLEINEAKLTGNLEISKKIIDKLPYTIDKNNKFLNKIIIQSTKDVIETSKNSKGQVTSYRTVITINFKILNKDGLVLSEKFLKREFSYNSNENKFKFKEYQSKIEDNLINKIAEDIIIDLNL
jgi:outer membrane lipopolysaccharide assembly protein LptE/RlpB|tara:strand:- start:48 stop:500 length:453 start_codon:yes stop_codon:yes gene_type:complete